VRAAAREQAARATRLLLEALPPAPHIPTPDPPLANQLDDFTDSPLSEGDFEDPVCDIIARLRARLPDLATQVSEAYKALQRAIGSANAFRVVVSKWEARPEAPETHNTERTTSTPAKDEARWLRELQSLARTANSDDMRGEPQLHGSEQSRPQFVPRRTSGPQQTAGIPSSRAKSKEPPQVDPNLVASLEADSLWTQLDTPPRLPRNSSPSPSSRTPRVNDLTRVRQRKPSPGAFDVESATQLPSWLHCEETGQWWFFGPAGPAMSHEDAAVFRSDVVRFTTLGTEVLVVRRGGECVRRLALSPDVSRLETRVPGKRVPESFVRLQEVQAARLGDPERDGRPRCASRNNEYLITLYFPTRPPLTYQCEDAATQAAWVRILTLLVAHIPRLPFLRHSLQVAPL